MSTPQKDIKDCKFPSRISYGYLVCVIASFILMCVTLYQEYWLAFSIWLAFLLYSNYNLIRYYFFANEYYKQFKRLIALDKISKTPIKMDKSEGLIVLTVIVPSEKLLNGFKKFVKDRGLDGRQATKNK